MKHILVGHLPAVVLLGALGCAAAHDEDVPGVQRVALETIHRELELGDRGTDVEAVYGYLTAYGYFPNQELERRYPNWAPVVPDAPTDPGEFDGALAKGVVAFQSYADIEQTGTVDARTLQAMKAPRCGHPENENALRDPTDKFALFPDYVWNKKNITFKITKAPSKNQVTSTMADSWLSFSLNTWNAATFLQLQKTSGTPDIEIKFWTQGVDPPGIDFTNTQFSGQTFIANTPVLIGMNEYWNFNPNGPFNSFWVDGPAVLLHEVGHSLGLSHTAPGPNNQQRVMSPFASLRTLTDDDHQAIGVLYNGWKPFPGSARDITGGIDSGGNAEYWAAGMDQTNAPLNRWNRLLGRWEQVAIASGSGMNGVQALSEDVFGNVFACDFSNAPWFRSVSSGGTVTWTKLIAVSGGSSPTCKDIAANGGGAAATHIGGNQGTWSTGTVWAISNERASGGSDRFVQQLSGGVWNRNAGGVGVRIAVDWFGRPWVVQSNGTIWRLVRPNATINSIGDTSNSPRWEQVPGCALDIGSGAEGSMWATDGCNAIGSERGIFIWNEQPGTNDGTVVIPPEKQFDQTNGAGIIITGGADGPDASPFVIQSTGAIWERNWTG
jgi:hypothetical protein